MKGISVYTHKHTTENVLHGILTAWYQLAASLSALQNRQIANTTQTGIVLNHQKSSCKRQAYFLPLLLKVAQKHRIRKPMSFLFEEK